MRFVILLIVLFPSFVFAIECPAGTTFAFQGGDNTDLVSQVNTYSVNNNIPKTRITSIANGFNGTYLKPPSYISTSYKGYSFCVNPIPVTCTPPFGLAAGQFGVNFGCNPPECPASHPTPNASGNQCKDSNGCNQDQSFFNGLCVNKKIEDIAARCMAASGQSQVSTITVPADGSGATCSIGVLVGMGTLPACTTAPGGTACVVSQLAPGDKTGMQCGSFNGASVCVASSETNAIGTSTKALGTSTASGTPKTIEEQVSEMGQTTTTIKTTTPQTTTTTAVNDGSAMQEGQQMDGGAGSSPMPPIVCGNGMPAANIQSCDTTVTCPADSYVAYGVCIKMPTRSTVTAKDSTSTTVTVKNDSTGQTVSQTSSTTSVSTPVKNPSSLGTAETQRSGQCDPTAKNYQECVGLISSVTDTKSTEISDATKTSGTTALNTATDEVKNSINATTGGLGVSTSPISGMVNPFVINASSCSPISIKLGPINGSLRCEKFFWFKTVFAWFLFMATIFYLVSLFFRPIPN